MKEFMKMQTEKAAEGSKPEATADDKLQDKTSGTHKEANKPASSSTMTAAIGTVQATPGNTVGGDRGEAKPVGSEHSKTPDASAVTSAGTVSTSVQVALPVTAIPTCCATSASDNTTCFITGFTDGAVRIARSDVIAGDTTTTVNRDDKFPADACSASDCH